MSEDRKPLVEDNDFIKKVSVHKTDVMSLYDLKEEDLRPKLQMRGWVPIDDAIKTFMEHDPIC